MGNQHSSSSSNNDVEQRLRTSFSRHVGGAIGFNRNTELDKKCHPSGLYSSCQWEDRAIRRLIADGRIAARLKGEEYHGRADAEECPICFLYYNEVNITNCCNAHICTECFLQVRPQKVKQSTCPFCNCDNLSVSIAKKKTGFDSNNNALLSSSSSSSTTTTASLSASFGSCSSGTTGKHRGSSPVVSAGKKKSPASVAPHAPSTKKKATGFGSELEKDGRFKLLKKRSESFASSENTHNPQKEKEMIKSIAMTSEERLDMENEIKSQHYHPLVLQLEAEAQEQRLQNDRAYRGNSARGSNYSRGAVDVFRNQNMDSVSRRMQLRSNRNDLNALDDMVALEAAILFSLGEDEARRSTSSNAGESGDQSMNSRERDSFPLLRSLLTGQLDNNTSRNRTEEADFEASRISNLIRRRNPLLRSALGALSERNRGVGDATLDTASLLMHGISEEEQISMAIAASLRDQSSNNEGSDDESDDEDEDSSSIDFTSGRDSNANESSSLNRDSAGDSESTSADCIGRNGQRASSRDEASTITELARVVTDSAADGKIVQSEQSTGSAGDVINDNVHNGISA